MWHQWFNLTVKYRHLMYGLVQWRRHKQYRVLKLSWYHLVSVREREQSVGPGELAFPQCVQASVWIGIYALYAERNFGDAFSREMCSGEKWASVLTFRGIVGARAEEGIRLVRWGHRPCASQDSPRVLYFDKYYITDGADEWKSEMRTAEQRI